MRVVFMGTPEFSVPVLESLAAEHEVVAAYSQPPRPAGRGKKDRPSPVQARAEALGIAVRHPVNFKDPTDVAAFADLKADIAVVVAYGLILPQTLLDAPTHGCLNIHASLLPRWRGAAPIHRAILSGDAETGVCIMQMEAGLDTGPVLLREALTIGDSETTGALHDRLSTLGARMICQALADLEHLKPQMQPEEGVTYAKKIDKSEGAIDWSRPAQELVRQINGLSPFPGAYVHLPGQEGKPGERLKLLQARLTDGKGEAGTILSGFKIACGEGALEILMAQREGKKPMPAQEILKGLTLPAHL